jgi:integrase
MSSRNPNRASSVYFGGDGDWHGRVTVGYRDDGSVDRRHVRGKTKGEVVKKVRALERLRDQGRVDDLPFPFVKPAEDAGFEPARA